jgi:hypothetical protein
MFMGYPLSSRVAPLTSQMATLQLLGSMSRSQLIERCELEIDRNDVITREYRRSRLTAQGDQKKIQIMYDDLKHDTYRQIKSLEDQIAQLRHDDHEQKNEIAQLQISELSHRQAVNRQAHDNINIADELRRLKHCRCRSYLTADHHDHNYFVAKADKTVETVAT